MFYYDTNVRAVSQEEHQFTHEKSTNTTYILLRTTLRNHSRVCTAEHLYRVLRISQRGQLVVTVKETMSTAAHLIVEFHPEILRTLKY